MQTQAILFDHDGTLVDSERAHFEMWREILKRYDVDLSYDEYQEEYAGIPSSINAMDMVSKHNLALSSSELLGIKEQAIEDYLSKQAFPLMPGALEAIRFFAESGYKVGIVTAAGRESVTSTIEYHGLAEFLSAVVCYDDVINSKPAPDCYLLATKQLGLSPEACVAIEDTYSGSLAAYQAGVKCVGVSAHADVLSRLAGVVYSCENLTDAAEWIAENLLSCASK